MGNVSALQRLLVRAPQLANKWVGAEPAPHVAALDRIGPQAPRRQCGARDGVSNAARRSVRVALNLAPMGSLPNQRLQRTGYAGLRLARQADLGIG